MFQGGAVLAGLGQGGVQLAGRVLQAGEFGLSLLQLMFLLGHGRVFRCRARSLQGGDGFAGAGQLGLQGFGLGRQLANP